MNEEQALAIGKSFLRIWEDQRAFNTLFRQPPGSVEEMTVQAKEFVLYTESELHEFLRTFRWKTHRRGGVKENLAHMDDELADVLKCVLSLFQICGWNPERMIEAYDRKTALVKQRYREEWQSHVTGPCAIVDIDEVLCDYIGGLCRWMIMRPDVPDDVRAKIRKATEERTWISGANLGVDEGLWQRWKHEFRISGAKRTMPVHGGAIAFLRELRQMHLQIILLTSRPFDKYPNMQTDTLLWLQENELIFDYLWWGADKVERLLESDYRSHVKLVVDDDIRHLMGFDRLGIQTYLLCRNPAMVPDAAHGRKHTRVAQFLSEVLSHFRSI